MAQSITFNGTSQYTTRAVTNSAPYTSINSWRVEMRLTNIGSGTSYKIVDNTRFYIKINSATGLMTVAAWDNEIPAFSFDVSGFAGHLSDIVVRIQKDAPNNLWTIEGWDANSTVRFASGSTAGTGMTSRNFGNTTFYIGARSIEQSGSAGEYFDGRIAFMRWYSTLVSFASSTKPTMYANTADLLQMEYEGNLNDSSGNSQTFTGVGSPTYNTTPTINPIASAGTDIGGLVSGTTFGLNASNSVAGDAGPITTYSWTRLSGSGTISSPSSSSTNVTGISAGQSVFQVEVGDGTNTATDSVNVGVISVNGDGTVNVSNAAHNFILGPILPSGSVGALVLPYYDVNQEDSYDVHNNLPIRAPRYDPAGSLSVTNGSPTVTGASTLFTKHVTPEIPLNILGTQYTISSIDSDTSITLTANYSGSTTSGITNWDQNGNDEHNNNMGYWHYYDSTLTAYAAYYRTGLDKWLTVARKNADAWWTHQDINYGAGDPSNFNSPRLVAMGGLMMRAADGRPELWDWINRANDYMYRSVWVTPRLTYPGLYFGVRDGGYVLWFGTVLSQVLPDTYTLYANGTLAASTGTATDGATKRAAWLADCLNGAINYYCRLQRPDGSWRWGQDETDTLNGAINSSVTSLAISGGGSNFRTAGDIKINDEIMSYTSRTGSSISGITRGQYGTTAASHTTGAVVIDLSLGYIEQTFHVGVGLGAAFYDLMRILEGNGTYQAEYNTMRHALIRNAGEGMLMGYSMAPITDEPTTNSRYMSYALHSWGDWGPTKDGMPDTVPAWPTAASVGDARQNVVTWVHLMAYAYHHTGIQWYKDQLDELLSSNWGKTGYAGTIGTSDGYYGLMGFFSRTGTPWRSLKDYNEWHRYIGRAFATRYLAANIPVSEPPWVSVSGGDRAFPNGTTTANFTAQVVGVAPFTYLWTNKGVNTATLTNDTTATVTASALVSDGTYGLRVAVTDANGKTSFGFVNFRNVSRFTEARPPIASVPNQNVSMSAGTNSTALNLSGSTVFGGRSLKYRWFQTSGPSVTISNYKIANPSVTLSAGTYTFRGFVWDNLTRTEEETGTDAIDVRMTVTGGEEPPPSTPRVKLISISM